MPDLDLSDCANDGLGWFPEYQIVIETVDGCPCIYGSCYRARWPAGSSFVLLDTSTTGTSPGQQFHVNPALSAFVVTANDDCDAQHEALEGEEYVAAGYTASGAPYYRDSSSTYYVYWDPSCDGSGTAAARWVVTSGAPSTTALSDLDEDGACTYFARVMSSDSSSRPRTAAWTAWCGSSWKGITLTLTETSLVTKFGDESLGASIECKDCYLSGSADVHVLVRVDQYNPFAESWSWGSVDIDGNIDLTAKAWLNVERYFEPTSILANSTSLFRNFNCWS